MKGLEHQKIQCPYCGESIEVVIDCSVEQQSYIEDCSVCCSPINFDINIDSSGELTVHVTHENE
jgi:transcription elongation factor Elf1